jgi:hypothetical protein
MHRSAPRRSWSGRILARRRRGFFKESRLQFGLRTITAAAVAVAFAGCAGGGGKVVPTAAAPVQQPPTTVSGSAKVALSFHLPARKHVAPASVKRPSYVTGAIDGLAIRAAATGGGISSAAWQLFDLSPSSALCATQSDGSRNCTLSVYAPVASSGQDEFQIASYDATSAAGATTPAGNAISAVDAAEPISVGTANAFSIQLDPVVASVATDSSTYYTWAAPGQSSSVALTLSPSDADGASISADTPTAAPYAAPISFSDTLSPSPFTYTSIATPGASATVASTVKYTAPAAGTVPPASATVSLHGGAPAWVPGASANAGTFTIVPMILAGNAANVQIAPNGPAVPVTIAESGATGAYAVSVSASSASGETISLVDANGNPVTSVTPDGSGNATAYVKVTASGSINGATSTLTVTDAHGVAGTVPLAIASTTTVTIALPGQTGTSVYYNVTGYPNTGSAIALAGSPASPYILVGDGSSRKAIALHGSPGSVTTTDAGAVGMDTDQLASDGTNLAFTQYSTNNLFQQNFNTPFNLGAGNSLSVACDVIASGSGIFYCEGNGFYGGNDDYVGPMTTGGGNYSQFTHYTNNPADPGLHVFTAAPGGVFYGGTPTQLWSVTNVYPSSDAQYNLISIGGIGSFDGLTANANGDLFVADGTNNKLWKIAAPVSASSTPVAVPGPSGGWRHPNGVVYDTNSKILWVVEGANGTSLGRVDKVTGY